jgi:glycosyltransferase involved in cell wall biosynthesis
MNDVLLVVSADLRRGTAAPSGSAGPRKDYAALAETLHATVLDRACVEGALVARTIARLFGAPAALAWLAFRRRHSHRAILTDGEHIGIPLALLLKLAGATIPHVTIGHRLTSRKKRPFFRWFRAHTHMARIALHATRQYELAVSELGIPTERLALVPYQVDADFWHPLPVTEERLICSAGREYRDYPTLFKAMEGLDARAVIGASSHWSRRPNSAAAAAPPPNVEIGAFDYEALRRLYARAAVVVVPLEDVDNQAGVTAILEAMAMGKALVVTQNEGQTDLVEDRRLVTYGPVPRTRPVSLLRTLAEEADVDFEPNGFYVPPRDPDALRRAIRYLLDHPDERARLGAAGRRAAERLVTVDQFAARLDRLIEGACAPPAARAAPRPAPSRAPAGLGAHPMR